MLECCSFSDNDINQTLSGDESAASVLFSKYRQIVLFVERVKNYVYFFQDYFIPEDLGPHCYMINATL